MDTKRFPRAWKHDSELALVRDDFYPERTSPDPFAPPAADRRQAAVDLVGVYLFRNPTTPHAMIATASLTEASLHDTPSDRDRYISENAMRSIYAMAFVKFVNGFVDRDVARTNTTSLAASSESLMDTADHRSDASSSDEETETKVKVKGGGESSMYAYAGKISMPEDFVDLRHNIVHGDIPSLDALRAYNKRALGWLWDKWWAKNVTGDPTRAKVELEEQQEAAKAVGRRRLDAEKTPEEAPTVNADSAL